ncbi:MAG: hypothetical protein ISP72_08575 [Flavobacteriaceae bacterium]|nr:hypothetical protein [Flavobacteriaceae bacterium]|tara:strand:- start:82 stop:1734 length:1653 start_codon:yes stop_codon:yes gene_type:complete
MATISFTLRSKKTLKTDVLIQFTASREQQTKRGIKGLKIAPMHWDSIKKRVTEQHEGFEDINLHLNEWEAKMKDAETKMQTGKLSYYSAIDYVMNKANVKTIDDYLETSYKSNNTNLNVEHYSRCLKYFKMHLHIKGRLAFEDVDNALLMKYKRIATEKVRNGDNSAKTFTTYKNGVMALINDAVDNGFVADRVKPNKKHRIKGRTGTKGVNRANTTEELFEALTKANTIQRWQSCALWLVMFGMRGMYPADLVRFTDARLKNKNIKPVAKNFNAWITDDLYLDYDRSKEETAFLYIRLFKPIRIIWERLKYSIIYTHSEKKIGGKYITTGIDNKISLFEYDNRQHPNKHKDMWDTFNDKFARMGLKNITFKQARKTFFQTAEDELDKLEAKWLVGHDIDQLSTRSYSDYRRKKIIEKTDTNHQKVLDEFKFDKLVEFAVYRLKFLIEQKGYPEWLMMVSGVHTDLDKKKVSVAFRDKRRYWVEVDKKYHRFFNDQSMEEDYWEDLDDYIDGQTNKKITERIYKKLSQIEAVKNDIQKKGKVIDLNKRTA